MKNQFITGLTCGMIIFLIIGSIAVHNRDEEISVLRKQIHSFKRIEVKNEQGIVLTNMNVFYFQKP